MASISDEKLTADGRRYYEVRVSRGRGKTQIKRRFYPEDGWSRRTIEREINKFAADLENQIQEGTIISRAEKKEQIAAEEAEKAKLKTVRQYAEGVYLAAKKVETSINTDSNYRTNLELHVYPVIGDMLLVDVTPAMLTKLLLDHLATHAHASTIKVYNILNGLFDMAFMDYSVPVNPMARVRRPKPKKEEEGKDESEKALTAEGLNHVLKSMKAEPLKWQALILLTADTGARRGEICGLEWNDINWEECTVTFSRNYQYNPKVGTYFTSPKNGKARTVDIGEDTLSLLRRWKEAQREVCICKYIFNPEKSNQCKYKADAHCHRKNDPNKKKMIPIEKNPMHPDSPTRYFKKFADRYNVPGFHPHLLRHTSASVAITNGADVTSVSARLGHSDPAVTLRMYSHANQESIRKAGQIVRDALKAAK
ncbi:MAG: tyrosine-type recombinase/integrase [Clostridia bacterium]|nr:tyrosine-type recombinase/integrase [Clostridia bacterium]